MALYKLYYLLTYLGYYDGLIGSRICAFDWHVQIFSAFCTNSHFLEATTAK